ncbi:MAG: hypothetical protein ACT4QE_11465 [Anaerolineales bacterium]
MSSKYGFETEDERRERKKREEERSQEQLAKAQKEKRRFGDPIDEVISDVLTDFASIEYKVIEYRFIGRVRDGTAWIINGTISRDFNYETVTLVTVELAHDYPSSEFHKEHEGYHLVVHFNTSKTYDWVPLPDEANASRLCAVLKETTGLLVLRSKG